MNNLSRTKLILIALVAIVAFILTIAAPFFTIFALNLVGAGVEYSFANIAALYVLGGITTGTTSMVKALKSYYSI